MTTTRGLGSTTSYNGGSARWEGLEDRQKTVNLRDLPQESQAVHELLKQLKLVDVKGRTKIIERAQTKEPITQAGLAAIADLYARLDMPLTQSGINKFKAERGLGTGPNLAGNVAKAFARAIDGGEVLFRVTLDEEQHLRPADKACLAFLRQWSRTPRCAEHLGRIKELLDLGNPPVSDDAVALANEYVGAQTVREVSKASSMNRCDLTPEGMLQLAALLESQRAQTTTTKPAAATKGAPTTKPTAPTTKPAEPTTTLPPRFAGSIPAQRLTTSTERSRPAGDPTTATTLTRPPSKAAPAPDAVTTPTLTRPPTKTATDAVRRRRGRG